MEIIVTLVPLVLVGLFIGVCSGMLGIGGGTIMVPILRLGFGLSAYAATATSLFSMIFTSISGSVAHIRQRTCIPSLGIALGLGGCVTSALGVQLARISPAWAIMLVAAIVIAYSAYNMLRKALKMPRDKSTQERKPEQAPSNGDFTATKRTLALGVLIGLAAGLCAGYVGVGGGFIMVPLMTTFLGVPMKRASGTSLVAIIILTIPGIIAQGMLGHIDYIAGIMLAVGSIPGAVLGANLSRHVPERQLRLIFAVFLGIGAVLLILNELNVL